MGAVDSLLWSGEYCLAGHAFIFSTQRRSPVGVDDPVNAVVHPADVEVQQRPPLRLIQRSVGPQNSTLRQVALVS